MRSSWETRHDIYELRQLDLVAVRICKRQGTGRFRQVMSVRGKAGETTREEKAQAGALKVEQVDAERLNRWSFKISLHYTYIIQH